jgi:lipopolysaccharide heptosyltransferase II
MMMTRIERLLVVSPNWLGDAVMALPAVGDLRRAFPGARLIVAARRAIADLFTMSPLVDDVIVMQWSGRVWARRSRLADIEALRTLRADASVLLPNSFASAWLVHSAAIPERWGYATDMRRWLLSRAVSGPAIRVHQAEYYRRLIKGLGFENGPLDPDLVVPSHAIEQARSVLRVAGWVEDRPFIVMAPGAAYGGAKRWPAEHFAEVATRLVRERGAQCVLIGSVVDGATTRWVRALVSDDARGNIIDLAGSTTLDTLAGILALARVCVSNDSGAMHLAGAVGVPLAALFGPTRERETAPLSRPDRRVEVLINHVWCRPCMLRECPLDHRCMKRLSSDRVLATVTDLLGNRGSGLGTREPGTSNPANPESRIPNPESRIPDPGSPIPDPQP